MVVRGEEEATIVIDVGSSSAKAGFSGEDMPRAVCPSVAEDLRLSAEELSTYRARRPEVTAVCNGDSVYASPYIRAAVHLFYVSHS